MLNKIEQKLGLDKAQIEDLKQTNYQIEFIPPISKKERMTQMVDLINLVQIDGRIDDSEYYLLENLTVILGYKRISKIDLDAALEKLSEKWNIEDIVELIH